MKGSSIIDTPMCSRARNTRKATVDQLGFTNNESHK
jgi:hypothetical protein